jgi:V/A-type H+/Na+-transporting ATPase subunit D
MNAKTLNPTRYELLKIKKKIHLAQKGHSLLKKKQDVLTKKFLEDIETFKEQKSKIYTYLQETYKGLAFDIAYAGIYVSRSVSYATPPQYKIKTHKKNIMGVRFTQVKIKKNGINTPQTFGNSPLLANATKNFQELFEKLVTLNNMEEKIYSLGAEIKKLRRRVNSLEHIQIPTLEKTKKTILFILEEQERDNFIRLKTIKNRMKNE